MKILVLNSGSSSLRYQLIDLKEEKTLIKGRIDGINLPTCKFEYEIDKRKKISKIKVKDHVHATKIALISINEICPIKEIKAVGHRVVHGGEKYNKSIKINNKVIQTIKKLSELAPLHNPANLAGIKACKKILKKIPQVAVFDTAFHQTIPKKAYLYGIPLKYYKKYKIRKYGFHGTSHKYLMLKAKEILKKNNNNLITCHLGNGSSVCAIKNNKSIDTTMGFTPLQGLMMGTRSGDIDPAIISFIAEKEKKSAEDVVEMLNKESGLLGIDGYSDIRTIHEHAIAGNKRCKLALNMYSYRVSEYIGAYAAVLDSIDAIVFTGGIGENAYYIRELICKHLGNLGIWLNHKKNRKNKTFISKKWSKIKIMVIPTNEELMIAKETKEVLK